DRLKEFNQIDNRHVLKVLTLDDFDLKGKTILFLRGGMNYPIDPEALEILGALVLHITGEKLPMIKVLEEAAIKYKSK
ncbi:MAG: hypothetical protein ACRBBZ_08080, partial [Nitrosopumilus sp.]